MLDGFLVVANAPTSKDCKLVFRQEHGNLSHLRHHRASYFLPFIVLSWPLLRSFFPAE